MKKQVKLILVLVTLFAILAAIVVFNIQDKELKVYFLDVGQGDSILIRTPNHQDILIDGGPDSDVVNKIGQHLPFYDRDIELMILTHAHSDHLVGLIEVLKRYQVDQILYSGKVDYQSSDYLAWLDIIRKKTIPLRSVKCCEQISLGENLNLDILYPYEDFSGKKIEDLNDTSIVAQLIFQNKQFLFTGDAPVKVEKKLIDQNLNLESQVLKVGHHGSKYSSSSEFLKLVDPQYAIIQSGKDNKFGHPHFKTLNNLSKQGIEILRNDQCGTIWFKTDGEELKVKSEKCQQL
ncbi:MAG: competence protein ComE [Candidatus Kerfeldbacteria bacterium CG_4_10_14_0_8_um_filter_42_10]|uniref:Competence protein ComE n=1 Tax=Candidatus Kerfeldbacteria bacterium CG_4_10_14_0_8_um_filter_42_10 TaxID=2014248 RepID=A0A2M7RHV5_9BACT|nr:MAG: competence protein ComE [Candidatus Kerfeldbacteria bacterium CG_4_10_14_0_8_um_filter_42_10]